MPLVPDGFPLTEEQKLVLNATSEFAREQLLPLDRKWDRDESSVAEVLPQLGEMGLLSLCLPEELNGLGCSYRLYAALIHELACWSPSVAVTLSVHNMVGTNLSGSLDNKLVKELLANWSNPNNLGAFCLSEAGAGSDAASTTTTAKPVDGGYRVSGEKMWITNGMHARWFLTLVRLAGEQEDKRLSALLIDGESDGIERSKIIGKMGIRGSETAVVSLNDVFVPEANLIGSPGEGLATFLCSLTEGRIGIAAQATGIAEACLNEMTAYAQQREQFGRPIGKFQAVGNMIADSAVELDAARALVWHAASLVDAGEADRTASSMAKLYASEAANKIAYRAVQVYGGAGYVNECRVEQLYRDARITTIYEGTSEIQRLVIARELGRAAQGH